MAIDIKSLLADALLELCKKKPLVSICIKDLLAVTKISRQTFYNHFRDKNDLIQWTYEHKALKHWLESSFETTNYYENTLRYYQAIDLHRNFLKQACAIREQNCLADFMFWFVVDFDIKWHQYLNGNKPLTQDQIFITKYHSIASIQTAIEWISSDNPEPPEVMAKRVTNIRKISMNDVLFGNKSHIYDIPEESS